MSCDLYFSLSERREKKNQFINMQLSTEAGDTEGSTMSKSEQIPDANRQTLSFLHIYS